MRFFGLAMGIAIVVQAVITHQWMIGIVGVLFTSMPIFNIGCCGPDGCAVPSTKKSAPAKDISYEEVG
ncbi:MAG: hypothetical protein JWP81_488 [Ferruginibacter sp.]|nr:hypothetical protein [Ferruginibacter sp.]